MCRARARSHVTNKIFPLLPTHITTFFTVTFYIILFFKNNLYTNAYVIEYTIPLN